MGTVQVDFATPPNQRNRADVAKLLVHPSVRRRGVARALMTALERIAQSEGRTLLTLDTVTGSSAEPLYQSLGYVTVGVIPRYARAALTLDLESTTIMYKELDGGLRRGVHEVLDSEGERNRHPEAMPAGSPEAQMNGSERDVLVPSVARRNAGT